MKRIITSALFALALYSCNTTTNPPAPSTAYFTVPGWANDTLVGVWNNGGAQGRDTAYAHTTSGQSYVKYHGVDYAVKAYDVDSNGSAGSIYTVDFFDGSNVKLNGTQTVFVSPWNGQYQHMMVNFAPFNTNVTGSLYSTIYK